MKALVLALIAATSGLALDGQITVVDRTGRDGSPVIEVQFYRPTESAGVFRVIVDLESETGRPVRVSKLVDQYSDPEPGLTMFSVIFDTGYCRVKRVRVAELGAVREQSQAF